MDRIDWTLIALAAARGESLSPVQLQKSLFLIGKNVPQPYLGHDFYVFRPYNYGPFDPSIYLDAKILAYRGHATATDSPHGWVEYKATPVGISEAASLLSKLPPGGTEYIASLIDWVLRQSFSSLIKSIYREYPEMSENSIYQD